MGIVPIAVKIKRQKLYTMRKINNNYFLFRLVFHFLQFCRTVSLFMALRIVVYACLVFLLLFCLVLFEIE